MKNEILNYIPNREEGVDWKLIEESFLSYYIERMKETPQNPAWHAEGNVFLHTKMVVNCLISLDEYWVLPERDRQALFLSALLHDIGKVVTTKEEDGVLRSHNHAVIGSFIARELLWKEGMSGTAEKQEMRESVCALVRFHAVPARGELTENKYKRYIKIASIGKVAPLFSIKNVCILSKADILGRISEDKSENLDNVTYIELLAKELNIYEKPLEFPSLYTERGYYQDRVELGSSLYDPTWGEVIILCGLPATGKDTYVRKTGLPMICLDDIRKEFKVLPTDNQGKVVSESNDRARAFLRNKQPFIWNATSITEIIRAKHIRLFESYGARVKIVFLETSWETELERNRERENIVPEGVIENMLSRLEPPYPYEAQEVEWLIV